MEQENSTAHSFDTTASTLSISTNNTAVELVIDSVANGTFLGHDESNLVSPDENSSPQLDATTHCSFNFFYTSYEFTRSSFSAGRHTFIVTFKYVFSSSLSSHETLFLLHKTTHFHYFTHVFSLCFQMQHLSFYRIYFIPYLHSKETIVLLQDDTLSPFHN